MTYDPELWYESAVRCIQEYVLSNIDTGIYDVTMEFPGAAMDAKEMPLDKTVIHFEVDDQPYVSLGFGDRPMVENYDAATHTVNPQWAAVHRINFDVGVWSSDKSGGTTARMRAAQILFRLFGYPSSITALRAFSDAGDGAVEIIRYSGGQNTIDKINDVRVYRMVGGELEIRVFSRTPILTPPSQAVEEIVQAPGLTIPE